MLPRMLAVAALLCAALCLHAAEEDGYEIHEWGVFSVPRNAGWANLDMKAEWAGMPKEFYGKLPGRPLPYRGPVRKPVIYFHAAKAVKVDLKIRFAHGQPMVWWPAAEHPVNLGLPRNDNPDLLHFKPQLVDRDPNDLHGPFSKTPRALQVEKSHWLEMLRDVKAATVFCAAGHSRGGTHWDTERFIYYDGLMKPPATPKVTRDDRTIVLETESDHDWLDVLAIERGENGFTAGAWIERIEAGKRSTRIELKAAMGKRGIPAAVDSHRAELKARLVKAGLHEDEALALVKVWDEGFFAQDGLTLFYRIPQKTYDQWLPLEAQPAPTKTVRVGLVLHQHLEPELETKVEALIKNLGDEAFDAREAAREALLKIGGAAFPMLEKYSKDADTEIAVSCRGILEALDARPVILP